uniref:NADH-ubiquinone oxidoreductase chain 3 n=1 Tax=Cichlidogyrus sclerosus TaxID=341068 RepID=A0A3G0WN00_9PLAT|nr:NADH dehydrogenase subunit 3 [Cichlidogyrus sclerosus]WRY69024.1 NADH dehydrogenase subunit 3 [Cichlidogyrus sclerosus]
MLGGLFFWLILACLIGFYQSSFFSGINLSGYSVNVWSSSFECGFIGHSIKINNFGVGFFLLLVFFVLFDLEISLLLNAAYQFEFYENLVFYGLFVGALAFGFFVEVCFGYVGWSA